MADKPSGTITFMFTDLEDSPKLWETHPEEMHDALARHDEILAKAVRVEFDRNMALLAEKIDDPSRLQTLLDQGSSFSLERALAYAQAGPEQA